MKYEGDSKILTGIDIVGRTVVGVVKPVVIGIVILGIFDPKLVYASWATWCTCKMATSPTSE